MEQTDYGQLELDRRVRHPGSETGNNQPYIAACCDDGANVVRYQQPKIAFQYPRICVEGVGRQFTKRLEREPLAGMNVGGHQRTPMPTNRMNSKLK